MSNVTDVCVIGLGSIGWGAALSLLREGFTVHGVELRSDVLDKFEAEGGTPYSSPAEAARHAPIVMIFVVNDTQTEQVLFGEQGAVSTAGPDTLFINCSTIPPSSAVTIGQRLESSGMQVMDAPVSGGPARALRGDLTVMASGSAKAFDIAEPMLDAISAKVYRLGVEAGQASRIKMINQLLSGVHIAATAEAITLAANNNVDLKMLYEVITHSTGNSWMFEDRGAHIVNGDYAPRSPIDIIVKDLGIVNLEAELTGSEIPLSKAALALFSEAAAKGLGREDGSVIAKLLGEKSGTQLPGLKKV